MLTRWKISERSVVFFVAEVIEDLAEVTGRSGLLRRVRELLINQVIVFRDDVGAESLRGSHTPFRLAKEGLLLLLALRQLEEQGHSIALEHLLHFQHTLQVVLQLLVTYFRLVKNLLREGEGETALPILQPPLDVLDSCKSTWWSTSISLNLFLMDFSYTPFLISLNS